MLTTNFVITEQIITKRSFFVREINKSMKCLNTRKNKDYYNHTIMLQLNFEPKST